MQNPLVRAVTPGRVLAALARGRRISVSAYTLGEGPMLGALMAAARRHAHVRVTLAWDRFVRGQPGLLAQNQAALAKLRAAGVHVDTDLAQHGTAPLHMKSAIVDGVAFLDDRNWRLNATEAIVEDDDRRDVRAIRAGQHLHAGTAGRLTTQKARALHMEAAVIRAAAGDRVDLETESLSQGEVLAAVRERAARGAHIRVLIGSSLATAGARLLHALRAQGVEVRALGGRGGRAGAGKMALTAGACWVGSANATYERPATIDWGLVTGDRALADNLRSHFEADWVRAAECSH